MKELNNEQINQLIAEKKFDEAKAVLKEFLDQGWAESENGEHYVNLMSQYMDMANLINQAYIEELESISQSIEEVDKIKDDFTKQNQINDIRQQISEL